jgi:SAM-dependent methyltransferase
MFFLRRAASPTEPLSITMSGLRMGERLLQVGAHDLQIVATMAGKVGLSGSAAIAVANEAEARRVREAVTRSGVLIDVRCATPDAFPFDSGSFDIVVVHASRGLLSALHRTGHDVALLQETHRVLRPGGRAIVIDAGPKRGLAGLVSPSAHDPSYEAAGGSTVGLRSAGFKPVRVLSERGGYRYVEGLKSKPRQ